MRFTNICLEGPDCSGKTTLFNNIHKETNYRYNIQDRSCFSMYVFASMYNRDKDFWYDKLIEDIKRLDTLYVLLLPPKEEVVRRIKKRGDNIQDENTIVEVWDEFNSNARKIFSDNFCNFMIIDATNKMESVAKVLSRLDYLNKEKGSNLIKNLVVESKKNELIDVSCTTYIDKNDLYVTALYFEEEEEYYKKITNSFLTKISKEFIGLNEYNKPQKHDSRRFIYTDDSCISMIHLLFRNNIVDFNVVMRSSNVVRTLWADYEFLKILACQTIEELNLEDKEIRMKLNIRSAHIVP